MPTEKDYEISIVGRLPTLLRDEIRNMNNERVAINKIDPFSLVCIEISENPGAIPFLITPDKTIFDFIKMIAGQKGISLHAVCDKLKEAFN